MPRNSTPPRPVRFVGPETVRRNGTTVHRATQPDGSFTVEISRDAHARALVAAGDKLRETIARLLHRA